jgi:5'-3' exonuclease
MFSLYPLPCFYCSRKIGFHVNMVENMVRVIDKTLSQKRYDHPCFCNDEGFPRHELPNTLSLLPQETIRLKNV